MRGCLIKLISGARLLPADQQQLLRQSPVLHRQNTLSHASLYLRVIMRINKDEKPLAIDPADEAVSLQHQQGLAVDAFLRDTASRYSHQRVIDFVLDLLDGRNEITSRDITLDSDESFILMILAIVRQYERQMPYQVRFAGDGKPVRCGNYRIPDMTLSRKSP